MRSLLRQLRFRSECLLSPRLRGIYESEPDRAILEEFRWKIAAGPFAGMRYISNSCGSTLAPKIIGCYERELHHVIEDVIAGGYDRIIDLGCAEGYYAVGLAWRTGVPVTAFDNHPDARRHLEELAELNSARDLIDIEASCGWEDFATFQDEKVFLICDIEGAEGDLLDPEQAPALLDFDLLVEVHDGPQSSHLHDLLVERFRNTHSIESIDYTGRDQADAGAASWVRSPKFRLAAVDEKRCLGLKWLVMRKEDKRA